MNLLNKIKGGIHCYPLFYTYKKTALKFKMGAERLELPTSSV